MDDASTNLVKFEEACLRPQTTPSQLPRNPVRCVKRSEKEGARREREEMRRAVRVINPGMAPIGHIHG